MLRRAMPPRNLLVAALVVALAIAATAARVATRRPPPVPPDLATSPALVAAGRQVVEVRCMGCHREVALGPRIRGWTLARAYVTLGRLPEVYRGMPPFPGTEEDRRAVAAYLAAVGAGTEPAPGY
jgi:mono/diheme cytochrome c family protein